MQLYGYTMQLLFCQHLVSRYSESPKFLNLGDGKIFFVPLKPYTKFLPLYTA